MSSACAIDVDSTTKLSPWLAHGCLSARRLYHECEKYEKQRVKNKSTYWLKHELIWRDYLRFGGLGWRDQLFKLGGIRGELKGIPWDQDRAKFDLWVAGKTGYPFVDCFMRELAATGYTTHCGRECVAWFMVRDLGLDWRMGAEYFESILIDYEPTANWGNWAYRIATTAPRKAPSPGASTQTVEMLLWAQDHDPRAVHVKMWLPELSSLPAHVALEPWRISHPELFPDAATKSPLLDWSCPDCTLLNEVAKTRCEVCHADRPSELDVGAFVYGVDYPKPIVRPKIIMDRKPATKGPRPRNYLSPIEKVRKAHDTAAKAANLSNSQIVPSSNVSSRRTVADSKSSIGSGGGDSGSSGSRGSRGRRGSKRGWGRSQTTRGKKKGSRVAWLSDRSY